LRRHKVNLHNAVTRPYHHLSPSINSMMEATEKVKIFGKSRQKVLFCKECGKEDQRGHLISHIEAQHSGVFHPCNICGKIKRTRESLRNHTKTHHTE